jgi:hypothetical protein
LRGHRTIAISISTLKANLEVEKEVFIEGERMMGI